MSVELEAMAAEEVGTPNVDFLTPAKAKAAREQRDRGFIFELKVTGGYAHVRRMFLADKAAIGQAPQAIQNKLMQAIAEATDAPSARRQNGALDVRTVMENLGRREDAANLACVAGFINPPLILREADRENDRQVLVTDLAIEDRMDFLSLCNGDEEEAKRLKPFLGAAAHAPASVAAG